MLFRRTLNLLRLKNRIECRRFKSDTDKKIPYIVSRVFDQQKEKIEKPVESGATRYWNLPDFDSQYFCGGAIGPAHLSKFSENEIDLGQLIDFKNKAHNKLHIDVMKCPHLLLIRLFKAFPLKHLDLSEIFIIKLSYEYYLDQKKGQYDCLIAANEISMQLENCGHWGYYSGAAMKNQENGILFYYNQISEMDSEMKFDTTGLHVNVDFKNDCLKVINLSENEVGIIYTNCNINEVKDSLNTNGLIKERIMEAKRDGC